jgi:hyperosmotically inducible protein
MFGCIGGLFRFLFVLVLLALIGAAAFYYFRLHPEKAPWKGGVASVQEKVETVKLAAEVKAALSLREAFNRFDLSVSAEKDVVTLRGKVPSAEISKDVEGVAASVPGVRQVVNHLEIDGSAGVKAAGGDDRTIGEKVDDEALELKIRAAFKLDRELAAAGFEVKVIRRAAQLSSATANPAQKKRALDVARSIEGVGQVEVR